MYNIFTGTTCSVMFRLVYHLFDLQCENFKSKSFDYNNQAFQLLRILSLNFFVCLLSKLINCHHQILLTPYFQFVVSNTKHKFFFMLILPSNCCEIVKTFTLCMAAIIYTTAIIKNLSINNNSLTISVVFAAKNATAALEKRETNI